MGKDKDSQAVAAPPSRNQNDEEDKESEDSESGGDMEVSSDEEYFVSKDAKDEYVEDSDEEDSEEEEDGSDEEEMDEVLDAEKLIKDEDDRKHLDSLPEFEREAILGERFEKRK